MAHDSCENVKSGSSNRNGGASGQEQRARASLAQLLQCSSGTGLSRHAGALHGSRDAYGAPTCPGVCWVPKRPGSCSYYTPAKRATPSCKCESRRGKAHRSPQPVTNEHELPNPRLVCISLSAWLCMAGAWQGRASSAIHWCGTNWARSGGDGSGARLAAGECWREYCSLAAE